MVATWSHVGREVSAHFAVRRDGRLAQFVSLRDSAYHVGGDDHRNDDQFWFGVENVGNPSDGLSQEQIQTCGRLFEWLSTAYRFPLSLAERQDDMGLGWHGMFHRGHPGCPGPIAVRQRQFIVDAARRIRVQEATEAARDLRGI